MAFDKQLNDKSQDEMTMGEEVPRSELLDGNHTTHQKHYLNNQSEPIQLNTINQFEENAQIALDNQSISCSNQYIQASGQNFQQNQDIQEIDTQYFDGQNVQQQDQSIDYSQKINIDSKYTSFLGKRDINKRQIKMSQKIQEMEDGRSKLSKVENTADENHQMVSIRKSQRVTNKIVNSSKNLRRNDIDYYYQDNASLEEEDEYASNSKHRSKSQKKKNKQVMNFKADEKKTTKKVGIKKSNFTKQQSSILRKWFIQNADNPYLKDDSKKELSLLTGLDGKQVANWFTNVRKRIWQPLKLKQKNDNIQDFVLKLKLKLDSDNGSVLNLSINSQNEESNQHKLKDTLVTTDLNRYEQESQSAKINQNSKIEQILQFYKQQSEQNTSMKKFEQIIQNPQSVVQNIQIVQKQQPEELPNQNMLSLLEMFKKKQIKLPLSQTGSQKELRVIEQEPVFKQNDQQQVIENLINTWMNTQQNTQEILPFKLSQKFQPNMKVLENQNVLQNENNQNTTRKLLEQLQKNTYALQEKSFQENLLIKKREIKEELKFQKKNEAFIEFFESNQLKKEEKLNEVQEQNIQDLTQGMHSENSIQNNTQRAALHSFVKQSKYLRFREKMKNVKMWKIDSIAFAEKNQEIIEFPPIYEPEKIEEKTDIDSTDIQRIQLVEEEFRNHELRLKAMIKQKEIERDSEHKFHKMSNKQQYDKSKQISNKESADIINNEEVIKVNKASYGEDDLPYSPSVSLAHSKSLSNNRSLGSQQQQQQQAINNENQNNKNQTNLLSKFGFGAVGNEQQSQIQFVPIVLVSCPNVLKGKMCNCGFEGVYPSNDFYKNQVPFFLNNQGQLNSQINSGSGGDRRSGSGGSGFAESGVGGAGMRNGSGSNPSNLPSSGNSWQTTAANPLNFIALLNQINQNSEISQEAAQALISFIDHANNLQKNEQSQQKNVVQMLIENIKNEKLRDQVQLLNSINQISQNKNNTINSFCQEPKKTEHDNNILLSHMEQVNLVTSQLQFLDQITNCFNDLVKINEEKRKILMKQFKEDNQVEQNENQVKDQVQNEVIYKDQPENIQNEFDDNKNNNLINILQNQIISQKQIQQIDNQKLQKIQHLLSQADKNGFSKNDYAQLQKISNQLTHNNNNQFIQNNNYSNALQNLKDQAQNILAQRLFGQQSQNYMQQTNVKNKIFGNNSNERLAFLNPNGSVGFTTFQATTANTEGNGSGGAGSGTGGNGRGSGGNGSGTGNGSGSGGVRSGSGDSAQGNGKSINQKNNAIGHLMCGLLQQAQNAQADEQNNLMALQQCKQISQQYQFSIEVLNYQNQQNNQKNAIQELIQLIQPQAQPNIQSNQMIQDVKMEENPEQDKIQKQMQTAKLLQVLQNIKIGQNNGINQQQIDQPRIENEPQELVNQIQNLRESYQRVPQNQLLKNIANPTVIANQGNQNQSSLAPLINMIHQQKISDQKEKNIQSINNNQVVYQNAVSLNNQEAHQKQQNIIDLLKKMYNQTNR